jgi:hypothetical protein
MYRGAHALLEQEHVAVPLARQSHIRASRLLSLRALDGEGTHFDFRPLGSQLDRELTSL